MKIDIMAVTIEPWTDNNPDVIRAQVRVRCGNKITHQTKLIDKNEYFISHFHTFMRIAEEEIVRHLEKENPNGLENK